MDPAKIDPPEKTEYGDSIVESLRDPLLILDCDLRVRFANRAFCEMFQIAEDEVSGQLFSDIDEGVWKIPALAKHLTGLLNDDKIFDHFEVKREFPKIGKRILWLRGRRLSLAVGAETRLMLSFEDVTDDVGARKAAETHVTRSQMQDKKIAAALQRTMLFQPKEDAFSGLLVQTAYATASEEALVGGDFWDTFAYDHGHVALVIGDVMGHGLTSAIFTTELKHTMRAYIREHEQPAQILYHMNHFLYQSGRLFQEGLNPEGDDAPVCIALAVIARETGGGSIAIAGMEPPMLVRANGDTEQSAAVGLPLGIEPNESYSQIEFQLKAGDTLILTTDGITEARRGPDFLDAEGLMKLAVASNGGTLKSMADAILNGARDFAGGRLRDDAALVLVRRTETSPHLQEREFYP